MHMNIHPLVARVALDLATLRGIENWEVCVGDAVQAVRSVAQWTEELHRSAQADLMSADCYITVPYLYGIADGAYAGEHPNP